jgi:hypothetical protein
MSTSEQQCPPSAATPERRFYPRFAPETAIFLPFNEDDAEASRLVNISENGLLISTPTALRCNSVTRLSIPLNGLPRPVRVTVRVAWASDASQLAGIQLLDLGEHDREQIRRWGVQMSPRLPQLEPTQPLLDASSVKSSSEVPDFISAFPAGTPLGTPGSPSPGVAALAFPPLITRPASDIDRRAVRLLLIATACLVTAVVVIKVAPGDPFRRSEDTRTESIAGAPRAQETLAATLTPRISDHSSATLVGALAPSDDAGTLKRASTVGTSGRRDSAKTAKGPGRAAGDENPAYSQSHLSLTTAVSAPTEPSPRNTSASFRSPALADAPREVTSRAPTPPSPEPRTPKQPVADEIPASDAPAAPATVSSYPSSSHASSNTAVAPTHSVLSRGLLGPSTAVDPPQNRTLEVHLPGGRSASVLSLPGEHLLESPLITMHIQRSVLMPPTNTAWSSGGIRKVVVGELISHIDPKFALPLNGRAVSLCVKATIAKDGRVENIKQILGPAELAPAVAKALEEWRYQPTLVDGQPVETQCYVTLQLRSTPYHVARR